jgi:hypothetical protein
MRLSFSSTQVIAKILDPFFIPFSAEKRDPRDNQKFRRMGCEKASTVIEIT